MNRPKVRKRSWRAPHGLLVLGFVVAACGAREQLLAEGPWGAAELGGLAGHGGTGAGTGTGGGGAAIGGSGGTDGVAGGGAARCVAEVSAGESHTCARRTDGTLWCWGYNGDGELGNGTQMNQHVPVAVTALGAGVAQIAASFAHTCARRIDDTLWCWGHNAHGQLGDGTTDDAYAPVEITALGATVAQVSGGESHTCARRTDDTLWCWGSNAHGQLGNGTTVEEHSPIEVTALGATVAEVSVGEEHTCARKTDGTLWCWGYDGDGELGDGTTQEKHWPIEVTALGATVVQVSAGFAHTCVREADDTLWCWGYNVYGQLGDGTTADMHSPVEVTALGATVADVAAGGSYTCARKTDGTLWCWGWNEYGQLGDGTTETKTSPVEVTALGATVAQVSGRGHTCARKTDNSLWCWGYNAYGQLGDGTTAERLWPAEVTTLVCP